MMENQGRARLTMFLALLALVGIAVKFLIIAALHFLRPDANPVLEPISNYGVGSYGFLLTVADIGSGLATLPLVIGLYLSIARHGRSYVGLFSLASMACRSCWLGSFRSISARKLRRSVGSITLSATYRSFVSLSRRSCCLCAWVGTSGGDLFGVRRLRCQLWSYSASY
jgi:hypothetical protein